MKKIFNVGARCAHLSVIALPLASLFVFAYVAQKVSCVMREFEKAASAVAYNLMSDFEGN